MLMRLIHQIFTFILALFRLEVRNQPYSLFNISLYQFEFNWMYLDKSKKQQ